MCDAFTVAEELRHELEEFKVPEECQRMLEWIAQRMNQTAGRVEG